MSTLVKGGRIGTWSSIWSAEMERLRGWWEQGSYECPFPMVITMGMLHSDYRVTCRRRVTAQLLGDC